MAAFSTDDQLNGDLAFRLVQDGPLTLFHDPSVLAGTLDELRGTGYRVVTVEAGSCATVTDLLDRFARAFDFPDYFGRNMNAFHDCMRDVADGYTGSATGLVITLGRYDDFLLRHGPVGGLFLDMIADVCRLGALFGHRMMCFVQSDDPSSEIPPVGFTALGWNHLEQRRRSM